MTTSYTQIQVWPRVCLLAFPRVSPILLTATSGATTTITSTSASFGKTSTTAYNGLWATCYDKSASTAVPEGESRLITAFSGTTALTTLAFTSAIGASDLISITPLPGPDITEAINDIVRTLQLPRYLAAGLVVAGDEPTVAGWTDVTGSPTQSLETTIVLTGAQSLKVIYTVVDTSVGCASIPVTEGEVLTVFGATKVTVGSVRLQLYDVTNSAEISHSDSDEEAWTLHYFVASIPKNCQNVQLRLINKTASTTAYLDHGQVLSQSRNYLDIPTSITDAANVDGLMTIPNVGMGSPGANTWVWNGRFEPYSDMTMRDYFGVNTGRVTLQPSSLPLYYQFEQSGTTLSAMTDAIYCSADVLEGIVEGAAARCLTKMAEYSTDDSERLDYRTRALLHSRTAFNLLQSLQLTPASKFSGQRRIAV